MRSRLPPFPSSVHPPSTRPCLSLSLSFLPPVSSLLPHPSSLLIPLSSLHLLEKETRWHLRPSAWVPRDLSLGSTSLGSLCSPDRLFALRCSVLHCVTSRRTCMCIASCFTLPGFTLLYFALNCTSHCLALASLTSACNTSHSTVLASGFHGNVLHCIAIASIASLSPLCVSSH